MSEQNEGLELADGSASIEDPELTDQTNQGELSRYVAGDLPSSDGDHQFGLPIPGRKLRATFAVVAALAAETGPLLSDIAMAAHKVTPKVTHIAPKLPKGNVEVTQTDPSAGRYMSTLPNAAFTHGKASATAIRGPVITVDDKIKYQKIEGIGAAMTDSSAWLIEKKLSPANRTKLMKMLFSWNGIHMNFLRIPIGASDFTANGKPYSYDDMPPGQTDPNLQNFSIAHDRAYIIPALRQVLAINRHIITQADPWSAPGWMKQNDALDNTGGAGVLLPQYYSNFAQYIERFDIAYTKAGIPINSNDPANEPNNQTGYPGMTLSPDGETAIINYLRPDLQGAGLNTQVFGNDLSWNRSEYATSVINTVPNLAGITWHCYQGNPAVMNFYQQKVQIMNECSNEDAHYAASQIMIEGFRNFATTTAAWNLSLDKGGPVQQPDKGCPGCFGIVDINANNRSITPTSRYYQLGQLGHFVHPGARRIASQASNEATFNANTNKFSRGISEVAIENPNGTKELIVYNGGPRTRVSIKYHNRILPNYVVGAGATTTFSWKK